MKEVSKPKKKSAVLYPQKGNCLNLDPASTNHKKSGRKTQERVCSALSSKRKLPTKKIQLVQNVKKNDNTIKEE